MLSLQRLNCISEIRVYPCPSRIIDLFVPALPQIFREVRQPHQDNRQPRNVRDMNPARIHARNDNRHKKSDDGSDKEHLELIQFNFLFSVDRPNRIVII